MRASIISTDIRSAARVMNGAGDENPPPAVDHQGAVVVRHVGAKTERRRRRKRQQPKQAKQTRHYSHFLFFFNSFLSKQQFSFLLFRVQLYKKDWKLMVKKKRFRFVKQ